LILAKSYDFCEFDLTIQGSVLVGVDIPFRLGKGEKAFEGFLKVFYGTGNDA
jgi:hypothetical protein